MKYLNNIRPKTNLLGTSPVTFFYEDKSHFSSFSYFIGQFLTYHTVSLLVPIFSGLMNTSCDTASISFTEEQITSATFL